MRSKGRPEGRPSTDGLWTASTMETTRSEGRQSIDGLRTASSGRSDDGRPAATDEPNVQNLPRDRRAKQSGEMQGRAVAHRCHHGVGKRRVVGPATARLHEHESRLADDGAVPREADANRDLIVIMRRAPAGRDSCRDAVDAGDSRLRLRALRRRPEAQRDKCDRGQTSSHLMCPHAAFAARHHK